jgi:Tfp pilus assembly protein PilP
MSGHRWLGRLLLAALMGFGGLTVQAQDEEEPQQDILDLDEEVDVSGIEQILRGDQEVMQGELFAYDPAGRRDPFRSLLEGFQDDEEERAKVRPPGLPGMLVEELRIEGIIRTPGGILAFVQGRDNLSYIIRPGTKLYNGEVKEILPDRVVFRQQVDDPKQSRPYEEVVRELKY